jgi:hypothetical protein
VPIAHHARAAGQSSLPDLSAIAAVTAMRNGEIKAENYARALPARAEELAVLKRLSQTNREMVLEGTHTLDVSCHEGRARLSVLCTDWPCR